MRWDTNRIADALLPFYRVQMIGWYLNTNPNMITKQTRVYLQWVISGSRVYSSKNERKTNLASDRYFLYIHNTFCLIRQSNRSCKNCKNWLFFTKDEFYSVALEHIFFKFFRWKILVIKIFTLDLSSNIISYMSDF